MKLAITVLLLVVLPTALLSLLAGRSISAREVLLQQRWEESAGLALNEVSDELTDLIEADVETISHSFDKLLAQNARFDAISTLSTQLCHECILAEEVYLFMNPWGFIFPEEGKGSSHLGRLSVGSDKSDRSDLYAAPKDIKSSLVQSISQSKLTKNNISCTSAKNAFVFQRLPNRKNIYAGFSFDRTSLAAIIRKLLRNKTDRGLHFTAHCDLTDESAPQLLPNNISITIGNNMENEDAIQGLTITDSLTPEPIQIKALIVNENRPEKQNRALASLSLPAPLESVQLKAYTKNPEAVLRASLLQGRLLGWGVFLLAVVITASSGILIVNAVSQAKQARTRSEFVFGISHDLRTPLSSMRMLAESLYLKRVSDPSKQQRFLKTIVTECERLGDMIERLLFFMRQENKASVYTMQPVDMGNILDSIVKTFSGRHNERFAIDLRIEHNLPMVNADSESISKVVMNLLDNAFKYGIPEKTNSSSDHTKTPDVLVSAQTSRHRGKKHISIKITDFGMGINKRETKRIFRKFYRADTPKHKHVGGIGLGLSLCKDIVEAHGGSIYVESKLKEGATFVVNLPCE